ncbi:MAG: LysM peptidoglycan-binding domain-containing protein [Treponemataceae bacterium]
MIFTKKSFSTLFFLVCSSFFLMGDDFFDEFVSVDYESASFLNSLLIPIFDNMLVHEEEVYSAKQNLGKNIEDFDPIVSVITPEYEKKPRPPFISLDLHVPKNNKRIDDFRNQYLGNFGKQWAYTVMERGLPYRKYIQRKVEEYDMPKCMEFLPVIESMFKNDALSKSGALGMWQFMKNSIGEYNIRANDWIDERRDPWITTDAALKKLIANKRALGDWYLALAAYNAGLGRIRGAIKKAGGKADYWYLSEKKLIPTETINYVPKFLAISEIFTNAEYYDVLLPKPPDEEVFNYLETNTPIDIRVLAQKMDVRESVLQFLNPALNYNVTPPAMKYRLRLPHGTKEVANQIIKENKFQLLQNNVHTVRTGDTLYVIAQHYGVSLPMIEKANPELKVNMLRPGQTIFIPILKETTPYKNPGDLHKIEYDGWHTVERGDTLWNLALRYNVQVEDLALVNNLSVSAVLLVDSKIKVPIIH